MKNLVRVEQLTVEFPIQKNFLGRSIQTIKAVNGVSFEIREGETVGLVGESGCGKSTLGKALIRIIEPTSGKAFFESEDLGKLNRKSLRAFRRKMQIIFQDPFSSLNPRMKVYEILAEPLHIHQLVDKADYRSTIIEALKTVGLPEDSYQRYPHEFSGGQRQRIGIARALMVKPRFVVADEPVSALDVSIQAQIINLLRTLQKTLGLTYLFISHDLNVIRYICDRVIVMYLGKIMEIIPKESLLDPSFHLHPYTKGLIDSVPRKHPLQKRTALRLNGDIPSASNPPSGCVFRTRCPEARSECSQQVPELRTRDGRLIACHLR